MKKSNVLLILSSIVTGAILLSASPAAFLYKNKPPMGVSGSPSDGNTCAAPGCHTGSAVQSATGWITSNIPSTGYLAGTTYTITATATKSGINRFGFEVSPQTVSGTILGTLINTSSQTAIVGTGYIAQTSSGMSGSGSKSWSFNWIAPSQGTGNVTFYGAFNAANGTGGTGGDKIYTSTLTVSETAPVGTDAGIKNIVFPSLQACSTTFSPQVTLINYGATALTSATINYQLDGGTAQTYSWTGSLASFATAVVVLPSLTTTNTTHTFDASTTNPNGTTDVNAANDAATTTTFSIATTHNLPFTESFEGATFPPTDWTIIDPNAGSSTNITWVSSNAAASSGSKSAKFDNFTTNISGQHDILMTPLLDLTSVGNAVIKFDIAYAPYNNGKSDTLKLWVSKDCGATYDRVYFSYGATLETATATTSSFVPSASQWKTDSVDLSAYAGNNLFIKFENVSSYQNNLYIDNVSLTGSGTPSVTTSINDNLTISDINLYPNPAHGMFTLSNNGNQKITAVQIYSTLGKLVKVYGNVKSNNFDISSLSQGNYIVKINVNGNKLVKKLIVLE